MTVADLIEHLREMPPDAIAYVVNTGALHPSHEPVCDVTLMGDRTVWIDS